jgi:hypothetical protein
MDFIHWEKNLLSVNSRCCSDDPVLTVILKVSGHSFFELDYEITVINLLCDKSLIPDDYRLGSGRLLSLNIHYSKVK